MRWCRASTVSSSPSRADAASTSFWSASILSLTTSISELSTPSRSRAAWIFSSSALMRPSTICFCVGGAFLARRDRGGEKHEAGQKQADAEA